MLKFPTSGHVVTEKSEPTSAEKSVTPDLHAFTSVCLGISAAASMLINSDTSGSASLLSNILSICLFAGCLANMCLVFSMRADKRAAKEAFSQIKEISTSLEYSVPAARQITELADKSMERL